MEGICFKDPLFHATVEERKGVTRRLVKKRIDGVVKLPERMHQDKDGSWWGTFNDTQIMVKPRYQVGEIVYLKEPYRFDCFIDETFGCHFRFSDVRLTFQKDELFKTKSEYDLELGKYMHLQGKSKSGYINKLFAPTWLVDFFPHQIEITAIRCERLQDISEEDCLKEGIQGQVWETTIKPRTFYVIPDMDSDFFETPQQAYAALIDKINGKGTWESNPWVWVYEYKLVK